MWGVRGHKFASIEDGLRTTTADKPDHFVEENNDVSFKWLHPQTTMEGVWHVSDLVVQEEGWMEWTMNSRG